MGEIATRMLPGSDFHLSELGLGCAPLGNLYSAISDETAEQTIVQVLESGIRYCDTAPYYGFGLSEARLGNALNAYDHSKLVLSSKVGRRLEPISAVKGSIRNGFASSEPFEATFDYSYDATVECVNASLKRLQCSSLDMVFVHDLGIETHGDNHDVRFTEAVTGAFRALQEMREDGLIRAIGLGANEVEVLLKALDFGDWDCFLLAGRYTLLEQSALVDLFPACHAHGTGIIIGGVYNSGILATGTKEPERAVYYNYEPADEAILQRVRALEAACDRFQVPLAAAALQFVLAHPQVISVLVGLASADQVRDTLALYHAAIPSELWGFLKTQSLIDEDAPTPNSA